MYAVDIDITDLEAAKNDAARHSVGVRVLAMQGPSGHPFIRVKGDKQVVQSLLMSWGYTDEEDYR